MRSDIAAIIAVVLAASSPEAQNAVSCTTPFLFTPEQTSEILPGLSASMIPVANRIGYFNITMLDGDELLTFSSSEQLCQDLAVCVTTPLGDGRTHVQLVGNPISGFNTIFFFARLRFKGVNDAAQRNITIGLSMEDGSDFATFDVIALPNESPLLETPTNLRILALPTTVCPNCSVVEPEGQLVDVKFQALGGWSSSMEWGQEVGPDIPNATFSSTYVFKADDLTAAEATEFLRAVWANDAGGQYSRAFQVTITDSAGGYTQRSITIGINYLYPTGFLATPYSGDGPLVAGLLPGQPLWPRSRIMDEGPTVSGSVEIFRADGDTLKEQGIVYYPTSGESYFTRISDSLITWADQPIQNNGPFALEYRKIRAQTSRTDRSKAPRNVRLNMTDLDGYQYSNIITVYPQLPPRLVNVSDPIYYPLETAPDTPFALDLWPGLVIDDDSNETTVFLNISQGLQPGLLLGVPQGETRFAELAPYTREVPALLPIGEAQEVLRGVRLEGGDASVGHNMTLYMTMEDEEGHGLWYEMTLAPDAKPELHAEGRDLAYWIGVDDEMPVPVFGNVSVSDDRGKIASVVVYVARGLQPGDSLSLPAGETRLMQGPAGAHQLVMTSTDALGVEEVRDMLEGGIFFRSSNDDVSADREVRVTITDLVGSTASVSVTVRVVENQSPSLSGADEAFPRTYILFSEVPIPLFQDQGFAVADPEGDDVGVIVQVTGGLQAGDAIVMLPNFSSRISANVTEGSAGVHQIVVATAAATDATSALQGMGFETVGSSPTGTRSIRVTMTDARGAATAFDLTVNVVAASPSPTPSASPTASVSATPTASASQAPSSPPRAPAGVQADQPNDSVTIEGNGCNLPFDPSSSFTAAEEVVQARLNATGVSPGDIGCGPVDVIVEEIAAVVTRRVPGSGREGTGVLEGSDIAAWLEEHPGQTGSDVILQVPLLPGVPGPDILAGLQEVLGDENELTASLVPNRTTGQRVLWEQGGEDTFVGVNFAFVPPPTTTPTPSPSPSLSPSPSGMAANVSGQEDTEDDGGWTTAAAVGTSVGVLVLIGLVVGFCGFRGAYRCSSRDKLQCKHCGREDFKDQHQLKKHQESCEKQQGKGRQDGGFEGVNPMGSKVSAVV